MREPESKPQSRGPAAAPVSAADGSVLPLALEAAHHPEDGWFILGITWTVAFAAAFLLGAGRDDKETQSV